MKAVEAAGIELEVWTNEPKSPMPFGMKAVEAEPEDVPAYHDSVKSPMPFGMKAVEATHQKDRLQC